ncbi:choice-of-anchor A family protein [Bacillus cytotoxicus]|uniref:SpaA isopeptide-forming pilin-related protein n=1 Tax=Bacillus cytotoxicus TaxID=580165 RepID=UPI001AEE621E|nr:SpaA isopeptide-forming pilin-related protein [Bacillus cytotoxicus]QTR75467.1 choice-of-anchor A family protein [Bacillus cytotoxicus]
MRPQLKKISIHFMVFLLTCVNLVIYLPKEVHASTVELKGLGNISHYNAVVFGNHSAIGGDIEGAIAIQGDMDASGYTVVGAATGGGNIVGERWIDEGYPSLLLSGKMKKSRGESFIVQHGIVVMTKEADLNNILQSYNRIVYKEKSEIDAKFNEFRNIVDQVNRDASQCKTNNPVPKMSYGIGEDMKNPNIYVSSEMTGKSSLEVRDVYLPNVDNKDFIVMYSDATEIAFKNGSILYDTNNVGTATDVVQTSQPYNPHSPFNKLYEKVIWAFPNAKKITTDGYGVVGSVFAPNAVLEAKGGSINGQIFVGELHQRGGFEGHNFQLNWKNWNKHGTGKVKIKKVDTKNIDKRLAGAKFNIVDGNEKVVEKLETDEKGEAISKDLPIGEYKIVEIEAPAGYELSKDKVIVTVKQKETVEMMVKNKKAPDPVGRVKLKKVDTDNVDKTLAGAKFNLVDGNEKVVEKLETDEKGEAISKDLPIGEYKIVEIEAPAGYELSKDKVIVTVKQKETVEMMVKNKKAPDPVGRVKLKKVDTDNVDKTLAGAKFNLVDGNEKVVEKLETDEKGEAISKDLPIGEYKIVEIEAPAGYELSKDKVIVTVKQKETVEMIVKNKKAPDSVGQIEIEKVDAEDSSMKLKGAMFQILNKDGIEVGILTTDEKGKAISKQLALGKYMIKEIKAPDGYMLLRDSIEIEVTEMEGTQKITVENTKDDWTIPNTGGTGTTIFYTSGVMLMFVMLFLLFRKRNHK